jgi:hypothetical protein
MIRSEVLSDTALKIQVVRELVVQVEEPGAVLVAADHLLVASMGEPEFESRETPRMLRPRI